MADTPLARATVNVPGGLVISLESPSVDDVLKMAEVIIRQLQGTLASETSKRRISRQGKHVYNVAVEQEIITFAEGKPDGFIVSDTRVLHRAEPLVRMALDRLVQDGLIAVLDHQYRKGKFGPFTKLYCHPKFEKG